VGSSTDTGNPPVVIGQGLRLMATAQGVIIVGDPGAVPGNARVDVLNTTTGQAGTTTSADDGSFELELAGSTSDVYRVYAADDGRSWTTELSSTGVSTTDSALTGRVFLLQSAQGYTPLPERAIRLSFFQADRLRFDAGCNQIVGDYSLCAGKLCASDLLATEVACGPERQAQDEWFQAFLSSSPRLTLSGAALTLAGAQASLELLDIELADPDRPLAGRIWTIDSFLDGGTMSSFPLLTPPTLQFGTDGSLRVFTSCNTGEGTYTRSGSTLALAGMTYAEEPCDATGGQEAQDRIEAVMTDGELSFEIEAARLTVHHGAPGLSATSD
jgi:heat shock protein HslJ